MSRVFMEKKKKTENNYNDSLLVMMLYPSKLLNEKNQLSNETSVLVSNNVKDFWNFCETHELPYKTWDEFSQDMGLSGVK